jgi:hypothetical protein
MKEDLQEGSVQSQADGGILFVDTLDVYDNIQGKDASSASQLDDVREQHSPRRQSFADISRNLDKRAQSRYGSHSDVCALPTAIQTKRQPDHQTHGEEGQR